MVSYLNDQSLPRGIRNNNPGNLVLTSIPWQGKIPVSDNTDGVFEQFTHIEWGLRALMLDLINDYNVGKNTIQELISEFAPAFENNTNSYINHVSQAMGINPWAELILTASRLKQLVRAIVDIENGAVAGTTVTSAMINDAFMLLPADKRPASDDSTAGIGLVIVLGLVLASFAGIHIK